ncbi:hypothetical protein OHC33_006998 [Knufia fluminis]|uniref:AAA+ ATPase domain-containing protein n=1 Tax=Knufia fluminis TaxID=191047 RepID=A0AAN8EQZ5_9EURO|nr:hypothetical protein OHC33_006998 [Knufia fluminis]
MDGSSEPSKPTQQNRRMTADWFRVPPTDYLNVSTITYPRGSRATVAELENDALVDVLLFRSNGRQFCRNGKQSEDWIIQLFVDTDDFNDATVDSTKFAAIGVHSKPLLDSLRPALASVHCPLADSVTEQHRFYPPFNDLFFAQGRILETLKYAGLGAAKEKQLRTLVTVMQVVLKKTNHQVREMAGKRIIDFENVWTLFPPGSFAVTDIHEVPHILQVIDNLAEPVFPDPNARKKEEKHMPFKFVSYGFDGYNFGTYEDKYSCWDWKGHIGVSSLTYRPLAFDERYGDGAIVKKAVERGRKVLEYQSYHYCSYKGTCPPTTPNKFSGKVKIDGRIIVDCLQARRSDPDFSIFFGQIEHPISPIPGKTKEIYNAMRPLYLASQSRRPNREEQDKRKHFFGSHDAYLMLMKPLFPAWSLDHNDWFWVNVSNLEPVKFAADPMNQLVDSSTRRMGLLNLMIQRKLQQLPADGGPTNREVNGRDVLMIMLSGKSGTGKTATVVATAELQKRPLLRVNAPEVGANVNHARTDFLQTLENAAAWQALVLFDNAARILGSNNKSRAFYGQTHLAQDIASMLERFRGVVFLTKQDNQRLIHEVAQQVQVHLQLDEFTTEKRHKIWTSRFREASFAVSEDTITDISSWDLNGHEIEHLFENLQLVYGQDHGTVVSTAEIAELRTLTCSQEPEEKESFAETESTFQSPQRDQASPLRYITVRN